MSGKEDQFPPLTPLEEALASIAPRVGGFDRERLLFLAGQASVQPRAVGAARWAWPGAFSLMTAVAASLLVAICVGPDARLAGRSVPEQPVAAAAPRQRAEVASEPEPAAPPLPAWLPQWTAASRYAQVRDDLLRSGGAIERPEAGAEWASLATAAPSPSYRQLLEQLLEEPPSSSRKTASPTLD